MTLMFLIALNKKLKVSVLQFDDGMLGYVELLLNVKIKRLKFNNNIGTNIVSIPLHWIPLKRSTFI